MSLLFLYPSYLRRSTQTQTVWPFNPSNPTLTLTLIRRPLRRPSSRTLATKSSLPARGAMRRTRPTRSSASASSSLAARATATASATVSGRSHRPTNPLAAAARPQLRGRRCAQCLTRVRGASPNPSPSPQPDPNPNPNSNPIPNQVCNASLSPPPPPALGGCATNLREAYDTMYCHQVTN